MTLLRKIMFVQVCAQQNGAPPLLCQLNLPAGPMLSHGGLLWLLGQHTLLLYISILIYYALELYFTGKVSKHLHNYYFTFQIGNNCSPILAKKCYFLHLFSARLCFLDWLNNLVKNWNKMWDLHSYHIPVVLHFGRT